MAGPSEINFIWSGHVGEQRSREAMLVGSGGHAPGKILKIRRSLVHSDPFLIFIFFLTLHLAANSLFHSQESEENHLKRPFSIFGRKFGSAMAGPAGPPPTALSWPMPLLTGRCL